MFSIFRKKAENPYFVGSNGTLWWKTNSNDQSTVQDCELAAEPYGVEGHAKNANSIKECWSLFFTPDMIEKIVFFSNQYIEDEKRFEKNWESSNTETGFTDFVEIQAVFGMFYTLGALKSHHRSVKELWDMTGTGVDILSCVMSLERFEFLLKHIRLDDKRNHLMRKELDKMTSVRGIYEDFVKNCNLHYKISEYGAIDQVLHCFQTPYEDHTKLKKAGQKNGGFKLFALVDCKSYYTSNLQLYVSGQNAGPYFVNNSMSSLVKRLLEPIKNTERNITISDCNMTSIPLVTDLLKDRITVVGIMRPDSSQLPPEFISTKDRKPYSVLSGHSGNKTLVSCTTPTDGMVLLLSTMHQNKRIAPRTGVQRISQILQLYEVTKSTVDLMDTTAQNHSVARPENLNLSKALFFAILNISGVNAHVVSSVNTSETHTRLVFTNTLGRELMKDQLIRRSMMKNLLIPIQLRLVQYCGIYNTDFDRKNKVKQKRSRVENGRSGKRGK